MKLSLNWLKDYIDLSKNLTAKQLAEDLTMSTVEVESIINQAEQFNKMVVGKVAELKKHPNADKLQIAMTNIGQKEPVQIVCGGINLKKGMIVAVSLPGSKVRWHGEGDLVEMKQAKVRGEKSFGMICSSNEIGLENMFPCSGEEITDLSGIKGIKVGQPLVQALGLDDVIFEIDNKSLTNRPDLWSHYGIARELGAIYKIKLKELELEELRIKNQKLRDFRIEIEDKKLCPRYIGCVVKNIKIKPSPDWMVKKLESVGQRTINNIVDITNYVMFDIGEPTHAFDVASLHAELNADRQRGSERGSKIIVRSAKDGEKIKTLDGEMHKLDENMLIIADVKKPIGIAGVMGGFNSEVGEKTTEIILEAATFNAISVRKTSQKLGLRTEASIRFEKNLDYNFAEFGMLRMLKLIKEIIPEAEVEVWTDQNYVKKEKIIIKVKHDFIEKRIGQKFKTEKILNILQSLGFEVKKQELRIKNQGDKKNILYKITVPSWRATGDISIPEDIVEEVARIYGYDNLKEKREMVELETAKYQPEYELENKIKNYLSVGCGMNEVFNYPWAEEKISKKLGTESDMIEIDNPPSEENKYLQNSLIPNLVKNVQDNLRYFSEFKIFELSNVFLHNSSPRRPAEGSNKLQQSKMLAGAVVNKGDVFLEVKGIVQGMNLSTVISDQRSGFLNSNKVINIMAGKNKIGWIGEMKNQIKSKKIALFEIDFKALIKAQKYDKIYSQIPQYPSIERDIAVEVDWDVKWGDLQNVILSKAKDPVVKEIVFLSEYDLGKKKSLAFRVIYQADRTLKDVEVEMIENKIIKLLNKKFNAELRK